MRTVGITIISNSYIGICEGNFRDTLPISYIQYEETSMTCKSGKIWTYPMRVKYETVMGDFVARYSEKLAFARQHILYGFHQQNAHKKQHSDGWSVTFNIVGNGLGRMIWDIILRFFTRKVVGHWYGIKQKYFTKTYTCMFCWVFS